MKEYIFADRRKLYEETRRQGISALVYDEICNETDIPDDVRQDFIRTSKQTILSNDRLIFETARQVRLLTDNGIRCAVLKGAAVAAYYSSPVLRRAGDIDIYVPDSDQFEKAGQVLSDNGFIREQESYSLHHVGFMGESGIETELHSALVEPFDDDHINGMIQAFEENLTYTEVMVRDGLKLPALSDKNNAVYLMLHLLSHFLGEGISVRQLVDISVIFNHINDEKSRRYFSDFMIQAGLKTFAVTVCGYCQRYLGLSPDNNPMAEWDSEYGAHEDAFCDIIEHSGDFGHNGAQRMAVPSDTSVKALWATFITQVRRQHPFAWKDPIKRPFLCIMVLIGFIRNNRKIRNVSTSSVIHDAMHRGREAGDLKVFKDDDAIVSKATGNSMWPFITDGAEVYISPVRRRLHRLDTVLYRRDNGMLVLHRIIKIKKDGYYMCGDNQTDLEGPVSHDSICGILKGYRRNGRYIRAGHLSGKIWALLRPIRKLYRSIKNASKK